MSSIPANPTRKLVLLLCLLSWAIFTSAQKTILVFSKTAGYRHSSITNGISAIQQIGNTAGFNVVTTEDATKFNVSYLSTFNAVVFLNTTGDILNDSQQLAFETYIKSGGGFVGIHAATDCEYSWPWYGQLVGAWFNGHPEIQAANINIIDNNHPSTATIASPWNRTDEWYNFNTFQSSVKILMRVDENSYTGGTMGTNHPIAWYHDFDGGRSWYTALGHTDNGFTESSFLTHLAGGINYAIGNSVAKVAPTVSAGADKQITLPVNTLTLTGTSNDIDGTITKHSWTKITGPAGEVIVTPGNGSTVVDGLIAGAYVFRITVTDNDGLQDTDDVQILVNAAENEVPFADAGPDKVITHPVNNITLEGKGTDNDGTISKYSWIKLSGPAGSNDIIQTPATAITNITGLDTGTYVYRLTVTDNDNAKGTDDIQIKVNAAAGSNNAPKAFAGADKVITLPDNTVTLTGSGTDVDGIITKYSWLKISGPSTGGGTIQTPSNATTNINNLNAGTYVYRFTVTDDNGGSAYDELRIKVNVPASSVNLPPVANAGDDITLTLPVSAVNIDGSQSADADGTIKSWEWKKLNGPLSGLFAGGNTSELLLSSLIAGEYEFRLIVTDNYGASDTDEVKVTVMNQNDLPVVKVKDTIYVTLPVRNTLLDAGSSTDTDGLIAEVKWTFVRGPKKPFMLSPENISTIVTDLVVGTYEFTVSITDDRGGRSTGKTSVIVKNSGTRRIIPKMALFPNPAQQSATLTIDADIDGRVLATIYDLHGRPVQENVYTKSSQLLSAKLTLDNLAKGIYMIEVIIERAEKVVLKLVKH